MNSLTHARPAVQTAADLEAAFRSEGFTPGAPPLLSARALAIDLACARRARCPACRRRLLQFRPFHRGDAYRVLLACLALGCGAGEER
jgi:hypothetical protein